jgi:hypothetical protein
MDSRDRVNRRPRRGMDDAAPTRTSREVQHPLTRLQRLIGNAQVSRMLAQRAPEDEEEPVQRALEDEEEPVQRAPEDEEEELVQTKADPGAEGGPVSESTASAIQGMRGSGAALDSGVRDRMEAAFDTSFADVRVHAGPDAGALNRSLSSKAFTTGSDVFLGPDASASDSQLLAHELTHVVQQRSMGAAISGGGMRAGAADDAYEQEADTAATRALETQTDPSELTGQ